MRFFRSPIALGIIPTILCSATRAQQESIPFLVTTGSREADAIRDRLFVLQETVEGLLYEMGQRTIQLETMMTSKTTITSQERDELQHKVQFVIVPRGAEEEIPTNQHIYAYIWLPDAFVSIVFPYLDPAFCQRQHPDLSIMISIYKDRVRIYQASHPCSRQIALSLAVGIYMIETALTRHDSGNEGKETILVSAVRSVVIQHEVHPWELLLSSYDCGRMGRQHHPAMDQQEKGFSFAPLEVPSQEMCQQYTRNGTIAFGRFYFRLQDEDAVENIPYPQDTIEGMIEEAKKRETKYYGSTDTYLYEAFQHYPIEGKRVLILGSETPWYEAICLAFGAKEVVTLDYNERHFHHPLINTVVQSERQRIIDGQKFDAILTISSLEHSGLGRYGDFLSPDADLEAMEQMRPYLAPDGVVFLAVPVGKDAVVWNAHRIYGRIRLPLLFKGWDVINSIGYQQIDVDRPTGAGHQPIFVLSSSSSSSAASQGGKEALLSR